MKTVLLTLFFLLPGFVCSQNLLDSVPMTFTEELIFIELRVNEHDTPLNFLFDTGAGITVIDSKVAKDLEIAVTGESRIATSGISLDTPESAPNRITIGRNLELDSVTLYLMDLSHISDYLNVNVDGVIGYDLLAKYITETNVTSREMRFYLPLNYEYEGIAEGEELTSLESNLFGILINVKQGRRKDSDSLNFQIDTGAGNHLTFHNNTVNKLQMINQRKRKRYVEGFGADSTITKNMRSRVFSVEFGEKRWRRVPIVLEVDPINSRKNSLADGLIGQRLLNDFNITYNVPEMRVYLEKRD